VFNSTFNNISVEMLR